MKASEYSDKLLSNFPFTPTGDQKKLIDILGEFLVDKSNRKVFVLKGYAGTGKTSFIKSLVKTLPQCGYSFSLMAPTGRAAKVITDYTSLPANTIHRSIYEITPAKDGMLKVALAKNDAKKKLFIVDEASMISSGDDKSLLMGRNILNDLFSHVFSSEDCSIIFIGDTAQLPPVGETLSVALNAESLERYFDVKVYSIELKEVIRQAKDSGILMNATALRVLIGKSASFPILKQAGFSDIIRLMNDTIQDRIESHLSEINRNETLIICRSNKQANRYNEFVRIQLGYEGQICSGDKLMVVKNNYHWLPPESKTGFIANGDIIKVKRVFDIEKKHGFTFADAVINFVDYPNEGELNVKLLLDTISSDSPSLPLDSHKKLFDEIYSSIPESIKSRERLRMTYNDPYYNALQIKFSYAVTCHKAQGGQWNTVFVDPGYMNEDMHNTEYLRWLYTAVTRAKEELLLINFNDSYFVL